MRRLTRAGNITKKCPYTCTFNHRKTKNTQETLLTLRECSKREYKRTSTPPPFQAPFLQTPNPFPSTPFPLTPPTSLSGSVERPPQKGGKNFGQRLIFRAIGGPEWCITFQGSGFKNGFLQEMLEFREREKKSKRALRRWYASCASHTRTRVEKWTALGSNWIPDGVRISKVKGEGRITFWNIVIIYSTSNIRGEEKKKTLKKCHGEQ